jgi:PBP1b-binding outer membrane lipoprotein LpoB
MFNKICTKILLAVIAGSFLLGGCSWVGRTAGKAQAKIERKAESLEQGYQDGYEQEKKRNEEGHAMP